MKFKKGKNYHIPRNKDVKVTRFKDGTARITYVKTKNTNLSRYRRKGNKMLDTKTGKNKEFVLPKFKPDRTIKRTMKETVMPLLKNNFRGGNNELFVTLTFKEEMNDFNELNKIFNNFWNRLCYQYNDLDLVCLYVKEMQQNRASWHYHFLMKEQNGKYLYIPNEQMQKIWGLGLTKTNRVTSADEYLHTEIDEETDMLDTFNISSGRFHIGKVIDYMCKLRTKSGEIPSNGRIHGKKGILKAPEVRKMTYREANNTILKDATLIKEDTLLLIDEEDKHIMNSIHNEEWNLNNDANDLDGDDTS